MSTKFFWYVIFFTVTVVGGYAFLQVNLNKNSQAREWYEGSPPMTKMNKKTSVSVNGNIIDEKVVGQGANHFLYNNFFGKMIRPFCRLKTVSKLYSFYEKSFLSRRKIKKFVKRYNINMDDYIIPKGGFSSFDDFFTRKLKPGARKIDFSKNSFVAPADSNLLIIPEIKNETRFFVKSKKFCLKTFLGDEKIAQEFAGGILFIFRLTPHDYHRFHFPCDGIPQKTVFLNGSLESVHPIAYKAGLMPLQENERYRTVIKTDLFGKMVFVSVGAMLVGKVTNTYEENKPHKKGDEIGYFSYGGSTVIVLLKPNSIKITREDILENSKNNIETKVKLGQKIGESF